MDRRLEVAIAAAKAGGEVVMRHLGRSLVVKRKADASPVTLADRETEQRITNLLRTEFPEHGLLGEELGEHGQRETRWIIDPIDGTKSFLRGIPLFATLVALEEMGEVTTGVIYAPATGDLLYAQKGQGAFSAQGPLRVSLTPTVQDAMLVFGGLKHLRTSDRWTLLERLVDQSARQRAYGDYYGYTFVARGQADAMIDVDLKPWDLAAPKIIVEEAGGRFTDFAGRATIYGGTAIASNGLIHDALLQLTLP
jgi:histidinol-phosphatase